MTYQIANTLQRQWELLKLKKANHLHVKLEKNVRSQVATRFAFDLDRLRRVQKVFSDQSLQ